MGLALLILRLGFLLCLTARVLLNGFVVIGARSHHANAGQSDDHGEGEKELFHFAE